MAVRSPDETAQLARAIGARMAAGDCILLTGDIGAGKTHFARHLIQSRLETPEDVPSPTFTLVQTYDIPDGEIWHADLYRLTDPDEIEELGLTDAFDTAICLVEWPENLGPLAPENALDLRIETDPDQETLRCLHFVWHDPKWDLKTECLTSA
ncbi:tRNA (adenosine(37)-N6)-threonylcarbamoyltransferase complex ATPase subunit type 1 TsaE [Sedimentitalea xiamensis]